MKRILCGLACLPIFLGSCTGTSDSEGETGTSASTALLLADTGADAGDSGSDRLPVQNFEAGFMSDHETFAYYFTYNGYLLELVDDKLEGASEYGSNFLVKGGAEITVVTPLLSELDVVPEFAASQIVGDYSVLRSTSEANSCTLEKVVYELSEEALLVQVRLCPGDDADFAEQAVENLFEGLTLELL